MLFPGPKKENYPIPKVPIKDYSTFEAKYTLFGDMDP